MVVEIGMLLNKPYIYYENMLKENGLDNVFNCITHDLYYTKDDFKNVDNMSEKNIKDACIRVRSVNNGDYEIQNAKDLKESKVKQNKILKFESKLKKLGYRKVFDTYKIDHHFYKYGMTTRVQLQETSGIGLLVFLDNKAYYDLPFEKQRQKLIDELNSYGFCFKYEDLGLDKLRTLYYCQEKYSNNQNT